MRSASSVSSLDWVRAAVKTVNCFRSYALRQPTFATRCSPIAESGALRSSSSSSPFECRCGSRCIGKTIQRLEARIKQHIPAYVLEPGKNTKKKTTKQEEKGERPERGGGGGRGTQGNRLSNWRASGCKRWLPQRVRPETVYGLDCSADPVQNSTRLKRSS